MVNETNIKVPKKYQNMIEAIEYDGWYYSCYSNKGYRFEATGAHTAIEERQSDMLSSIRSLEICECKDCK